MRGKLFYIAAPVGGQRIEIQRVETDGGIDKRIFFRKSYRLLARYYVRTAGDDARYTVFGKRRQQLIAVAVKLLVLIVRVRIKYILYIILF